MYSLPPAATTIQIPCKAKNAPTRPSIKMPGGEARIDPTLSQQQSNEGDIEKQVALLKGEKQPPQPDGGRNAWIFLAGCSLFEALIWGLPFSFGVFETFYSSQPEFANQQKMVAIIGTCQIGCLYMLAPISISALEAWPEMRRFTSVIGLAVVLASLVASSFAANVSQLIVTQGVLYGLGGNLLYTPLMFYLDEWFVHRKGLAFGVVWAGGSTAGAVFPFILTPLLDSYGFRTVLRAWSVVLLILCVPLIYAVGPRLPLPVKAVYRPQVSYGFVKSRAFIFFQLSSMFESLGYSLPSIFLPSYARSIGLSPVSGTLVLALLNASSVIGAVGTGCLSDRLHVTTVIAISTAGTTASIFLFWGFALNLPLLAVFAVAYGTFAGGFSTIWSAMIRYVRSENAEAKLGMLGLFSCGRGVGCAISGPLAGALLKGAPFKDKWTFGYGSGYGALILFTGFSALSGLVCFGAMRSETAVLDSDRYSNLLLDRGLDKENHATKA